ncbi:unnamed protein product, partial [Mesorhabditis belari]|uniref:G-protein coupled receptors family 1 profile domain-containing protein n=1 Tax=Mesorhabditis belari TaxID=2138241 RepID=A0AAF3FBV9_9BILA
MECPHNLTLDQRLAFSKYQTNDETFLHFHGYLMGSLAVLAFTLTLIFIVTTSQAIHLHRGSRKYRVLLLNRAIGDLIGTITVTISSILIIISPNTNRDAVTLIGCFFYSTFWSAFISYTSLSILKLYAVLRPFSYRKVFTFHKCIYIILVCWIIFVFCVSMCAGVVAIRIHVYWLTEHLHGFRYFFSTFICFDYTFTIIIFIVTVIVLKKIEMNEKKSMSNTRGESCTSKGGARFGKIGFPLWKLGLNVTTFAVFQAPLVIWNLYLFSKTGCFSLFHYAETMKTQAFVGATILLRIITDFFVSFITDYQLRKVFLDWMSLLRNRFKSYRSRTSSDTSVISDSQKKFTDRSSF